MNRSCGTFGTLDAVPSTDCSSTTHHLTSLLPWAVLFANFPNCADFACKFDLYRVDYLLALPSPLPTQPVRRSCSATASRLRALPSDRDPSPRLAEIGRFRGPNKR